MYNQSNRTKASVSRDIYRDSNLQDEDSRGNNYLNDMQTGQDELVKPKIGTREQTRNRY